MDMMRVEEEMRRGLEAANQLRKLLLESREEHQNDERVMALKKYYSNIMLQSFDTSISILKIDADHMVSTNGKYPQVTSGQHCSNSIVKSRKACHSRRSSKSQPVTTVTAALKPDGYAWRKYGQKTIVNAKHPREYFRCGYKDDQGCQATKQVQIISENPTEYGISYHGQHTCKIPLLSNDAHQINLLDSFEEESTNLISFGSNTTTINLKGEDSLTVSRDQSLPNDLMAVKDETSRDSPIWGMDNNVVVSPGKFMSQDYYMASPNLMDVDLSHLTFSEADHVDFGGASLWQ